METKKCAGYFAPLFHDRNSSRRAWTTMLWLQKQLGFNILALPKSHEPVAGLVRPCGRTSSKVMWVTGLRGSRQCGLLARARFQASWCLKVMWDTWFGP